MTFKIGNYYQHTSGQVICILCEIHTFFYGDCLLAETSKGTYLPTGKDVDAAVNWHQVSGWPDSCYISNGIDRPIEANEGS